MAKAELKTKKNDGDVNQFLDSVQDPVRREDAKKVCQLMSKITKEKPVMWGPSIVGFGTYEYKYATGREGTWMRIGFSPRKQNLTLYIMDGFSNYQKLLNKLGKHSTGKSCLYIKSLQDIDLKILSQMIEESFFKASAMGQVSSK